MSSGEIYQRATRPDNLADRIKQQAAIQQMMQLTRVDSLHEALKPFEFVHDVTADVVQQPTEMDRFVLSIPTAAPAQETISYDSYNSFGKAVISSRNSFGDTPLVGTDKTRFRRNVLFYKLGRPWTWDDLLKVADTNDPAARREQEQLIRQVMRGMMLTRDDIAFAGEPELAANGGTNSSFAKDSLVPVYTSGGDWTLLAYTGEQILADIQNMYNAILTDTLSTVTGKMFRLVLAPDEFQAMQSRTFNGTGDNRSIMEVVMSRLTWLGDITQYERLRLANATNNGPRGILYPMNDSSVVALQDPLLPTAQAPFQLDTGNWKQDTWGLTAGCTWFYPREARYIDGL